MIGVWGLGVTSTQKGLLFEVGVSVVGKIESSRRAGVSLLRLAVHSSMGLYVSLYTTSGRISGVSVNVSRGSVAVWKTAHKILCQGKIRSEVPQNRMRSLCELRSQETVAMPG